MKKESKPTKKDKQAVRTFVRLREDFQSVRKIMDSRIGRKGDYTVKKDKGTGEIYSVGGTEQDIEERSFRIEDLDFLINSANTARWEEDQLGKQLRKVLKRFPIYTEYLQHIKGVGEIAAGWIIGEYDIHRATTVSKLWQFTGLNPSLVKGKKRVENKDNTFSYVETGDRIPGDKLTPGFVAPFNQRLRTAMVGVLADGFIKAQNSYCLEFYYPYKERLANSDKKTTVTKKGGKEEEVLWKDTTKGHRDRAAKRYMIKMFLKDLYVAWRELEGLEVRKPYQEEYLGHKHNDNDNDNNEDAS